MRAKKHYHVTRKSRADTAAVLRAAVAVYLLYLAWKIATASGADASFSQPVSLLIGGRSRRRRWPSAGTPGGATGPT